MLQKLPENPRTSKQFWQVIAKETRMELKKKISSHGAIETIESKQRRRGKGKMSS